MSPKAAPRRVDVRRQPAIKQYLGPTGRSAAFESGEVEVGKSHRLRDVLDELGDMAFPRRCSCRVPAIVIDAAHDDGKLRAQLDCDFGRQSITQCM